MDCENFSSFASGFCVVPAGQQGLYDARYEHDSCGVGFVASIHGYTSHQILQSALAALGRLAHRGAVAADGKSSDGVGIMAQIPRTFMQRVTGVTVAPGQPLGVGMLFLAPANVAGLQAAFVAALNAQKISLVAWRRVPVATDVLGASALASLPEIWQAIVTAENADKLERRLYLARKEFERNTQDAYVCSLSTESVVYKALCAGRLLADFYPDLADPEFTTPFALFHQRYATNVLPSWHLAQPLRTLAHNGEINTIWGNRARMDARLSTLPAECQPILSANGSDSTSLDETVELLAKNGRTLAEAVRMLLPPAAQQRQTAFLRYHADCAEPWDGPAALAFADGNLVGAVLDRNGLRPCRYAVTKQGLVVVGSEAGLLDLDADDVTHSGRLGPGQMLVVDLKAQRLYEDEELHTLFDRVESYAELLEEIPLHAAKDSVMYPDPANLQAQQRRFGYTREDVKMVLTPMALEGKDAVWSMGDDTPIAPLAKSPRSVYAFFRQRFAQVTNPPIDSLRESCVISLHTRLGPWPDLLNRHARLPGLSLASPFLSLGQMETLHRRSHPLTLQLPLAVLECVFDVGTTMQAALQEICTHAEHLVHGGARILLLTDRNAKGQSLPIPMALVTGAVHAALVRAGLRTLVGLAVEAGDCRDLHHAAVLIGFGAGAICPWLALETAHSIDAAAGEERLLHTFDVGLAKVMSKMGISVVDSYRGAHLFDILGLHAEVVDACFPGSLSPISGIDFHGLEAGVRAAWTGGETSPELPDYGWVRFRKDDRAEPHAWQPPTVKALQVVTGAARGATTVLEPAVAWHSFSHDVAVRRTTALRDLLDVTAAGPALAIDAVEPPQKLVRNFIASAMSLGSLSPEAHQTITVGMNMLGARSNTGEGGEDPDVYHRGSHPSVNSNPSMSSNGAPAVHAGVRLDNKIKQVASGRFGVTAEYLVHAEELEIKIAQGSKPGEGGQLPSHKVTELIARLRHAQVGVSLISPPPHHDIYSIEDLAQLIYDLKRINPRARVGVKLVSELGVGTVAAGVAKAYADYVVIAGHSGGTGASPLSSMKYTGNPWEMGLAETQQVLMRNGLRGRVRLRADGGLCTARDVLIAALLGAEEYGFGTSVLVALGCDMARQCHLNTCPTGIATQKPELRAKFRGKPEHVVRFFEQLAAELQELLANLGLPSLEAAIGRVDLLHQVRHDGGLDLSPLLVRAGDGPVCCTQERNDRPEEHPPLDEAWVQPALAAYEAGKSFTLDTKIGNQDRTIGARLAGELVLARAKAEAAGKTTDAGPEYAVDVRCTGTAGQSFGAFAADGMHLELVGQANDFVGKGLCGGNLVLRAVGQAARDSAQHVILGNVALYGATSGSLFAAGRAGERFAVRNSGANAVVEGMGDHGCEYMTGGVVVVLGATGGNFGAGMTGGHAYVLDEDGRFLADKRYHPEFLAPKSYSDLSPEQQQQLQALVQAHASKTQSRKAQTLLQDWPTAAQKFVCLTPLPPV
ncbi:MAG TPA: glutamate synthase large subunit [Acidobacteriaceae bacterium]|jgi:glutamate synthase (NADPH/NADH) large chain|nr:glutamate synthase large subunit [Acidobacteriaceae bacterium]